VNANFNTSLEFISLLCWDITRHLFSKTLARRVLVITVSPHAICFLAAIVALLQYSSREIGKII
jgi:hypothetical protein